MRLDLSELPIKRAAFEIRYAQSFLIWDHAGAIWEEIGHTYRGMTNKGAAPNSVAMSLTPQLDAQVQVDKCFLVSYSPKPDLAELAKAAKSVFSIVAKHLEITVLTRIGLRIVHEKKFDNERAAADFILERTSLPNLKGKHANIQSGQLLEPQLSIKWEGETTGCQVMVRAIKQVVNIDLPDEIRDLKQPPIDLFLAVADIDYYAHGRTPMSRFDGPSLIKGWNHLIRTEVGGMLGG